MSQGQIHRGVRISVLNGSRGNEDGASTLFKPFNRNHVKCSGGEQQEIWIWGPKRAKEQYHRKIVPTGIQRMVINHVHHESRERYSLILRISTVYSIMINSYVVFVRCPGPAGTMPATHSEKRILLRSELVQIKETVIYFLNWI